MIPYNQEDHRAYVESRCAVVCTAIGIAPVMITKENYEFVRDMVMATYNGPQRNALLMEATSALFMSIAHSNEEPT